MKEFDLYKNYEIFIDFLDKNNISYDIDNYSIYDTIYIKIGKLFLMFAYENNEIMELGIDYGIKFNKEVKE